MTIGCPKHDIAICASYNILLDPTKINDCNEEIIFFYCFSKEADVSISDKIYENTPLHISCTAGHFGVVKHLLGAEAEADLTNINGDTPLHLAAENKQNSIMYLFLNVGVDINAQNKQGCTALFLTVNNCHVETAQALMNVGADANIRNEDGITCAHLCARHNLATLLNDIVNNEGDVDTNDHLGRTPLHVASHYQSDACLQILLLAAACVSSLSRAPVVTPLYCAAYTGGLELVTKLLTASSDVTDAIVGLLDESRSKCLKKITFTLFH